MQGFGKVIEINPDLVIPNKSLSISNGAIKPFEGKVYGHCLNDLLKECEKQRIDPQKYGRAFSHPKIIHMEWASSA